MWQQAGSTTVITLAGGSTLGNLGGSINGIGTAALFFNPYGVSADAFGNVYVADYSNHKIRLIYPNQTVITFAGGSTTGTASGSINGIGTAALFANPSGVSVDAYGNVYVADYSNHKIRLVYPNQTVITLAGGSTTGTVSGSINGIGTAAFFYNPRGVSADAFGNVYVADTNNHQIRLIYPNQTVITLAGGSTTGFTNGSINGIGTAALFNTPSGVSADAFGNVYVADRSNNKIRLIYPNQTVITLAGGSTTGTTMGFLNNVGTAALFHFPYGVSADAFGNVYVADGNSNNIRLIYPNKAVISFAGGSTTGFMSGSINGIGTAALFNFPYGVSADAFGNVYVADYNNNNIRLIYPFSCYAGTYVNFASRRCSLCSPGTFSNTSSAPSCSACPAGTLANAYGSSSCTSCPGGHYCPAGTASFANLNCGRGNYCADGSAVAAPCPFQMPPSGGSWKNTPQQVQGPAFLVETAACLNHCFWNFTNSDGLLSTC